MSNTGIPPQELHGPKPLTVTVAIAREISGLGNTTIWALISSGKLQTTCVGRRRLIVYHSLQQLLLPAPSDSQPQPQRRRRRPAKPQWATDWETTQDDCAAPQKANNAGGV
jgi:hypothetical protein